MSETGAGPAFEEADVAPERERLHPLTLFTGLGAAIKGAWGAVLGGLFFVAQGRAWIAAVLFGAVLLLSLGSIVARYLSFSFRVEEDEIDLASGILSRNQRSIPFDRIQDVNIEQGILHRIVGLARVKLETGASAASNEEDGVIDSIALARADDLRDRIRAHRSGVIAPTPDTPVEPQAERPALFAMDVRRLVQLALFSFSLAIVGALFGVLQTYGEALGIDMFEAQFWEGALARTGPLQDFVLANRITTAAFGVFTLLFAGVLTGFVRVIPRDWGFRLDRTETGLRRRRGLFTLTDVVVPLKRVQAAIIGSGPIRRHFGFSDLKLQSLGRDTAKAGDHVVVPLGTDAEIDTVLHEVDTIRRDDGIEDWHRPARGFVTAYLVSASLVCVPISIGIAAAVAGIRFSGQRDLADPFDGALLTVAIAFLGLLTLATLFRLLDYRHRRHAVAEGRLLAHRGWWRRRLVILPLNRIQSADIHSSFFKRWFGIADVSLGVAGGSGFSAHGVEGIGLADAYALRDSLLEPVR